MKHEKRNTNLGLTILWGALRVQNCGILSCLILQNLSAKVMLDYVEMMV